LKEVAEAVDLTPTELASIERTSMGLDIPALKRLATFFGTTLNGIMGAASPSDGQEIVMRDGGVLLPRLGIGLKIERFGSGSDMMDCQRWTIDPGVGSNGSYRHEGEEFIAVLAGTFEITLAEERVYVLTSGDTIYFKSGVPHSWRNPGMIKTEMIWICAGHSF
jgi:mannose-6-phosphate isomerase-like protein (cupin superfamily)